MTALPHPARVCELKSNRRFRFQASRRPARRALLVWGSCRAACRHRCLKSTAQFVVELLAVAELRRPGMCLAYSLLVSSEEERLHGHQQGTKAIDGQG